MSEYRKAINIHWDINFLLHVGRGRMCKKIFVCEEEYGVFMYVVYCYKLAHKNVFLVAVFNVHFKPPPFIWSVQCTFTELATIKFISRVNSVFVLLLQTYKVYICVIRYTVHACIYSVDINAKWLLKTFHFALFGVEFIFLSFVIKFPDIKFNSNLQFSHFFSKSSSIYIICGINVHCAVVRKTLFISWLTSTSFLCIK